MTGMTIEEKREERAITIEIEIMQENVENSEERVREIEERIKVYQEAQVPRNRHQVPPYDAESLKNAKIMVEKNKERLEYYKSQLRSLHARVKSRLEAEKQAERKRAEELPKIAEKRADKVESIDPEVFEVLFQLARAKETAAMFFNAREQHRQDQVEADYLRSKGHKITKLRDPKWPTCLDELESVWKRDFGEPFEVKRTPKKAVKIAQMKGALRDAAVS